MSKPNDTQKLVLPSLVTLQVKTFYKTKIEVFQVTDESILQGAPLAAQLPHGSLYVFDGGAIFHGTTRQPRPNRLHPSRISLVFYRWEGTLEFVTQFLLLTTEAFHMNGVKLFIERHRDLYLRNHGKEHVPHWDTELISAIDQAQLKLIWLKYRSKQGDFKKLDGVLMQIPGLMDTIETFQAKWENWNGMCNHFS